MEIKHVVTEENEKHTHSNLPSWSPIFWTGSSRFLHTHSQASSLSISRWNMSQIMDIIWLVNRPITNWKITMLSMGKSTISMVIFHSYVSLPKGMFTTNLLAKQHICRKQVTSIHPVFCCRRAASTSAWAAPWTPSFLRVKLVKAILVGGIPRT